MTGSDQEVYRRFVPLLSPYRRGLALALAASVTGPFLLAGRIRLLKVLIDDVLRGHRPGLLAVVRSVMGFDELFHDRESDPAARRGCGRRAAPEPLEHMA